MLDITLCITERGAAGKASSYIQTHASPSTIELKTHRRKYTFASALRLLTTGSSIIQRFLYMS